MKNYNNQYHKSVLFNEVRQTLTKENKLEGNWYLDCTLGDGGYSLEILRQGGRVVGLDVDPEALERSRKRFAEAGIDQSRYILIRGNFRDLENLISSHFVPQNGTLRDKQTDSTSRTLRGVGLQEIAFQGAILDLGVSSLHLWDPERGFSFAQDGPLDMRMDPTLTVKASDLVNGLYKGELDELFSKLGEEKYSRAIAEAIISTRSVNKIEDTRTLAEIVVRVYRRFGNVGGKIHPATRVFQALRIAVNDELNVLKSGLEQVLGVTQENGYILVISFHSLEDRIVKNTFRQWNEQGLGEILTKKPIVPTEEEIEQNPPSRSAKMRIFRKGKG